MNESPSSRIAIYILYHNDSCYQYFTDHYAHEFPRFLYHKLEDSIILESSFYLTELDKKKHHDAYDWIGTFTYKAFQQFPPRKVHNFINSVEMENDMDVGVFFVECPEKSLQMHMRHCHPGLYEIFKAILIAMGEDVSLLDSTDMVVFHRNLWVARKEVTMAYIEWLKKVWNMIENNNMLRELLYQDSNYTLWNHNPDLIQRIFKVPHIPFFPFLFERLPCYFFYSRNYRVCMF